MDPQFAKGNAFPLKDIIAEVTITKEIQANTATNHINL